MNVNVDQVLMDHNVAMVSHVAIQQNVTIESVSLNLC